MNWQHFKAFVWLRWRLFYNAQRRAGALNAALTVIFGIGLLVITIPLFVGALILGLYAIPKAEPAHLMYVWDGLVVAFLFFWMIGLIAELQRTDSLSLTKFMHLPVSLNSAFLINYLSSLLRLSLIIFVPVMLAYSLALIAVKGITMVPVLLLLAAFVLMITALTYQFQGWLASLMTNPRRRRTVIVVATAGFVLIMQLPNLLNFLGPWRAGRQTQHAVTISQEQEKLNRELESGRIDVVEFQRRLQEIADKQVSGARQADREMLEQIEQTVLLANVVLPVGWLPLGTMAAAERNMLTPLLGLMGMALIGSASLYRAYRTTVRMYQGATTGRKARAQPAVTKPDGKRKPGAVGLLEAVLPGVPEPVAAVALAGFRSLVRAPEAKMMLLSPIIMSVIFGSMIWRGRASFPDAMRPLVAIGGMAFVLFGVVQLMSNQFGFDRDGFRVFVLSAARRRDILMGKNLSFAPLVLGMGAFVLIVLQVLCPLRWDHFLAMIPQYISMYLLFCLLMNFLSIFAPVHVAAGSIKPANPKLVTVLLHLLTFMIFFPLTQSLTLIPLGTEMVLRALGFGAGLPVCLLLSIVECAAVAFIYYVCSDGLGSLLQSREQRILEVVTTKAT